MAILRKTVFIILTLLILFPSAFYFASFFSGIKNIKSIPELQQAQEDIEDESENEFEIFKKIYHIAYIDLSCIPYLGSFLSTLQTRKNFLYNYIISIVVPPPELVCAF